MVQIIPLADDARAHDNSRVGRADALVQRLGHARRILQASDAGDGVRAARVDDDAAQARVSPALEHLAAEGHGRGLELVLGEDGGGGAGAVRRDDGEVGLARVAGLDADEDARRGEALRVGPGRGHVLDLGPRYGAIETRVCARELHRGLGGRECVRGEREEMSGEEEGGGGARGPRATFFNALSG